MEIEIKGSGRRRCIALRGSLEAGELVLEVTISLCPAYVVVLACKPLLLYPYIKNRGYLKKNLC